MLNQSNRNEFIALDTLRGGNTDFIDSFYKELLTNDTAKLKKFYFAMEFNKINNPDFNDETHYPLSMMSSFKRPNIYTPQINNISFKMPSFPLLYKWNQVPTVISLN